MKVAFLLFGFLFLFPIIGASQSSGSAVLRDIPLHKHFGPGDYDGGIQSWSYDQDSSDILYVANNNGLLEFDGNKWRRYQVPFCTKVRAVKVDSKNRVFVGGQGQIGYFTMTENGLVFESLLKKLPDHFQNIAETWKILEHNNRIFFNTESQLIVLDGDNLKVLGLPGYMKLAFETNTSLIAQFYNKGLFKLVRDTFISIPGTENMPDLVSILPLNDGKVYFGINGDIFQHDDEGVTPIYLPFEMGEINSVVLLSSGEYAVGTQNNGLYILNSDLSFKQHLTKNEGLSDRTIKSLYEDEFHNLWVALNNGIDYLELSLPFSLINDQVGLEGTGYASCKYDNQIYLGTNNGLFVLKPSKKDDKFPNYRFELISGSEGQVYNFSAVGNKLVLNHNRGAFQINGDELVQFHDIGCWKFIQTTIPNLILGGDYQGLSFFNTKSDHWFKVRSVQGLNESSRVIEFENDSTLWMTHGSKGAFCIKFDRNMQVKGEIEHYGEKNGFPSNTKISVYSLNENLVFAGEKGIYNFNRDSHTFTPNSFFIKWLGTEHISSIASNGSNSIYYIQDQKLGQLSQENYGTYIKSTDLFKHVNSFINNDLPNITFIDKHDVIIGAKEGFVRYDANKEFQIHEDFHVNIRSLEISYSKDSSILYYPSFIENKEIEINKSVKFQYAAPYFDGFEYLQYSYRLLPLDDNWSKWSSLGEKEYPYLPSGEYTFEVKGLNVYGLESPVVSFSYIVLNPWYFSRVAILVYVVLVLIAIALIPLIQRTRHRREKSILYENKERALNMKDDEINLISQNSKNEIDRITNEKLITELNLKNDQLTTITMHLVTNNEFIQEIRRKINTNLNEDRSKQDLSELIKLIDDNLADNDSWDRFAYHFDQVHGDYLKKLSKSNIKLSPREIKLAAFLRMNMSSKEISNLMNISTRGVELARHRLRKKLQLNRDQNLVEYLIELDNT